MYFVNADDADVVKLLTEQQVTPFALDPGQLDQLIRKDLAKMGEARAALRDWLADRVAKWWLPERWTVVDEVPKTSVGKFSKKDLRARFT